MFLRVYVSTRSFLKNFPAFTRSCPLSFLFLHFSVRKRPRSYTLHSSYTFLFLYILVPKRSCSCTFLFLHNPVTKLPVSSCSGSYAFPFLPFYVLVSTRSCPSSSSSKRVITLFCTDVSVPCRPVRFSSAVPLELSGPNRLLWKSPNGR